MDGFRFSFCGVDLMALPSGALWWPDQRICTVSDLHLGKSDRLARRGGSLLPPYETIDTLARLDAVIEALDPAIVVCLGDSFDDLEAAELPETQADWLARLMAGRRWIWIEGNHDPGPVGLSGEHLAVLSVAPLSFRHIADPGARAEVSGHYHPKARVAGQSRPCFLVDQTRLIMPAFGTYTGGLASSSPVLTDLMASDTRAILTGAKCVVAPMPR